ncbi:hypothetical protein L6164_015677 [Bauhinia variegata]|uniref:Uncharacterized protein n=1 Tax=Bauhinia variegata TaxID=167791 RepID=A0ACB9NNE3_BAUVA|nr:hypothetical protein L6164_015677 [Bauhinia variegata]
MHAKAKAKAMLLKAGSSMSDACASTVRIDRLMGMFDLTRSVLDIACYNSWASLNWRKDFSLKYNLRNFHGICCLLELSNRRARFNFQHQREGGSRSTHIIMWKIYDTNAVLHCL